MRSSTELGRRGLTILALIILTLMALGGGAVAQQRLQQVEVANTPDQPVPVAGTVDVANLPATQSVTGSVAIDGPVTIDGPVDVGTGPFEVTATTPLPVALADAGGDRRFVLTGRILNAINAPACTARAIPFPEEAVVALESVSVVVATEATNQPTADVRLHRAGEATYSPIALPLTDSSGHRFAGGRLDLGGIPVDTRADAPADAIAEVWICVNRGGAAFGPAADYVVVASRID